MSSLIVTIAPTLPGHYAVQHRMDRGRQHRQAPPGCAAEPLPWTPDAEVVVVVPIIRLSWHRVDFPKGTLERGFFQEGNAPRLRAVLDGLLEDRLLDDTAQLHFAIRPRPAPMRQLGRRTPVTGRGYTHGWPSWNTPGGLSRASCPNSHRHLTKHPTPSP